MQRNEQHDDSEPHHGNGTPGVSYQPAEAQLLAEGGVDAGPRQPVGFLPVRW